MRTPIVAIKNGQIVEDDVFDLRPVQKGGSEYPLAAASHNLSNPMEACVTVWPGEGADEVKAFLLEGQQLSVGDYTYRHTAEA